MSIFKKLLDALYPRFCLSCNKLISNSNFILCSSCEIYMVKITKEACIKCGAPTTTNIFTGRCIQCAGKRMLFKQAFAVTVYSGIARDLILSLKYGGKKFVADYMGILMAEKLIDIGLASHIDYVIPVPMKLIKKISRGYNQSVLLGNRLSIYISKPLITGNLIKIKNIKPQAQLNLKERLDNTKGAFQIKNSKIINGKIILLVDDVLTTGSTLSECALELMKAGAKDVICSVFARDLKSNSGIPTRNSIQ